MLQHLDLPDVTLDVESLEDNQLTIYPTVTEEFITIEDLDNDDVIIITDLSGKTVLEMSSTGQQTVNVSSLSSGMYIMNVIGKENRRVTKFVKM